MSFRQEAHLLNKEEQILRLSSLRSAKSRHPSTSLHLPVQQPTESLQQPVKVSNHTHLHIAFAKPQIELEKFDGRVVFDNGSKWLDKFKTFCNMTGVEEESRAKFMQFYLTNRARDWYECLSADDTADTTTLETKFTEKFTPHNGAKTMSIKN